MRAMGTPRRTSSSGALRRPPSGAVATSERRRRREAARRAAYRRRRLRALGLIAALAAIAGAAVGSGAGSEGGGGAQPVASFCDPERSDLARAAGQGVMVRMELRATDELRRQARSGEIGGVVLFPPEDARGERLAAEIAALQEEAARGGNPPLLVAIDQEGGIVERLPALAPQLSPYTLAQNDDPRSARLEGRAAGFQLHELGVNVDLAPVLDVPESAEHWMTPRAFGSTPEQVSRLGLRFAGGLQSEGVAATAKHFPGLGRAPENTDYAPTTVDASARELRADMEPFAAAVRRGVRLVMMSSAAYPTLGSRDPAVLSPQVVGGELRERLGFDGVVISDDLLAPAVATAADRSEAAVRAAAAGVDVLLFARKHVRGVAAALVRAVQAGELDEAAVRASCARVESLKRELAAERPLAAPAEGSS